MVRSPEGAGYEESLFDIARLCPSFRCEPPATPAVSRSSQTEPDERTRRMRIVCHMDCGTDPVEMVDAQTEAGARMVDVGVGTELSGETMDAGVGTERGPEMVDAAMETEVDGPLCFLVSRAVRYCEI